MTDRADQDAAGGPRDPDADASAGAKDEGTAPRRPASAREAAGTGRPGGDPADGGPRRPAPARPPSARDAGGSRRPPSARDGTGRGAAGPPAPRPVRPLRAAGEEGREDEEGEEEKRPTPVRAAMGVARDDVEPLPVPTRTLPTEAGQGKGWIVREAGRASSGQPSDPSAPLLFLTFAREEEPETPVRETLAVGRSLEALSEAQLEAALRRARPFQPRPEPEEIFPGTRRPRGRGGR